MWEYFEVASATCDPRRFKRNLAGLAKINAPESSATIAAGNPGNRL